MNFMKIYRFRRYRVHLIVLTAIKMHIRNYNLAVWRRCMYETFPMNSIDRPG